MNYKEIEALVNYYEDRIKTNFDEHFNQLILEDFYDGGFEDRIEDNFFYHEYFTKYELGIINLLLEIETYNDEYKSFKIRLVTLKRIIDNKLLKYGNTDLSEPKRNKRVESFLINSNIDKPKFIQTFYDLLFENKLIDVNSNDFKTHFSNDWSKMKWHGTEIQITNLFSNLVDKKILDPETGNFKYKLIATHFLNKNSKPFIEKQLGSVYSEKKEFVPSDDIILKIIQKLALTFIL